MDAYCNNNCVVFFSPVYIDKLMALLFECVVQDAVPYQEHSDKMAVPEPLCPVRKARQKGTGHDFSTAHKVNHTHQKIIYNKTIQNIIMWSLTYFA